MIRLRDVRKVYPTRHGPKLVLDSVSFDLAKGERLGVLGRNGAGKSTMVRLISGAEFPTSGAVERDMSVSWPLAFGGAFQLMLTGVDNVRFISRIYNQDFEKNLAFVEDFAELGLYLREPVRTYSSGMRARLAFAISMIIEFDCFLIDEVGAVGDARFHERCNFELFQKRSDRAMVIISHDAGYIRDHCNRFAVLHDGQLDQFDDFEVAYSSFKNILGISSGNIEAVPLATEELVFDRKTLIRQTHRTAVKDERFRALVFEADLKAGARDWPAAESLYAQALALFPFERSYWAQLGHMAKEGGHFARAEIAYRTASAFGELNWQEVMTHVQFVMEAQGLEGSEFPVPHEHDGPDHTQPPGRPDVEALSLLLWQQVAADEDQILRHLRELPSLDLLAASMIDDGRFAYPIDPDIPGEMIPVSGAWAHAICCIAFAEPVAKQLWTELKAQTDIQQILAFVMDNDGFKGWPETQKSLERRGLVLSVDRLREDA